MPTPQQTSRGTPIPELQARIDSLPPNDEWGVETARILMETTDELGASDLHVMSLRDHVVARARREDEIIPLAQLPRARRDLLIARFKVLARLPAYKRNEPQDGRIEWRRSPGEEPRVLRAAFLPTIHGENMVLRFPEPTRAVLTLDRLGLPGEIDASLRRVLAAREGTILFTGPSGSGKTTTLYALLRALHADRGERLNFLTIEDPVERELEFASQVQVDHATGMTFATALRAALRHDPNVLLIGEIRDLETANIAIQAGMTGHLVLSTIHAGRATRVFTRVLSLGVEPYLAASALTAAVAQRLVRTLCPSCRMEEPAANVFSSTGCEVCGGTGWSGRRGVFEIVSVSERLRELIIARASADEIAAAANHQRTGDIVAEGRRLVQQGIISPAEFAHALALEESVS